MAGSTETWHGIPREEIAWHPRVVNERCLGCGLCVTSCGREVYRFDYQSNRPVVAAPDQCMVGCTTCATICLQDAIEFPSRGYIRGLIRSRKILRHSKGMLRESRARYSVKDSAPSRESARWILPKPEARTEDE